MRMSLKQNAIQVIGALPEDASYQAVSEELSILAALDEAEDDIRHGRVISHEEVKNRFSSWISN
jgi:predicted transcriptional regulator